MLGNDKYYKWTEYRNDSSVRIDLLKRTLKLFSCLKMDRRQQHFMWNDDHNLSDERLNAMLVDYQRIIQERDRERNARKHLKLEKIEPKLSHSEGLFIAAEASETAYNSIVESEQALDRLQGLTGNRHIQQNQPYFDVWKDYDRKQDIDNTEEIPEWLCQLIAVSAMENSYNDIVEAERATLMMEDYLAAQQTALDHPNLSDVHEAGLDLIPEHKIKKENAFPKKIRLKQEKL